MKSNTIEVELTQAELVRINGGGFPYGLIPITPEGLGVAIFLAPLFFAGLKGWNDYK